MLGGRRFFRAFNCPGGISSHHAAETHGSIHEGGKLGHALSHAYGATFDNPDLVVGPAAWGASSYKQDLVEGGDPAIMQRHDGATASGAG